MVRIKLLITFFFMMSVQLLFSNNHFIPAYLEFSDNPYLPMNIYITSAVLNDMDLELGDERLAMLKYGISDLRSFFVSDIKWLNNFGFSIFENIEKI